MKPVIKIKQLDPKYKGTNGILWQLMAEPIHVWRGGFKNPLTMKEIEGFIKDIAETPRDKNLGPGIMEQMLNSIDMACKTKPKRPKK